MSVSPQNRIVCPSCGANNMDTQAACWKCGARLSSGGAGVSPVPIAPPRGGAGGAIGAPASAAGNGIAPAFSAATPVSYPNRSADPAVASWSSALLGLLFPYAAVPVGLVFLMLDDKRRAEVGRLAIIWGVIGSLIHTLAAALFMQAALSQLKSPSGLQGLMRLQQGIRAGQENRGLTEPVPEPVFPAP